MDGSQITNNTSSTQRGLGRGVSGGGVMRRGRIGRVRSGIVGIGRGHAHPHGNEGLQSKNRKWVRGKEDVNVNVEEMSVDDDQTNGVLTHANINSHKNEKDNSSNEFSTLARPTSPFVTTPFSSSTTTQNGVFLGSFQGHSFLGSSSTTVPTFGAASSIPPAPISAFGQSSATQFNLNAPIFTPRSAFGVPASTSTVGSSAPISTFTSTSQASSTNLSRPRRKVVPSTASRKSPERSKLPKNVPPYRIPPKLQSEIDQGKYNVDDQFPGNRFLELKALRPSMRAHSIKYKLISDPEHRTDLTGAITVVGTCMDMCPEYERHEREFQKDVDDWEKIPDTNPKRIDHAKAVKKYRRSAAGNDEPLESDLRPPEVLKRTLDYLFHDLMATQGMEATYAFIRDRTRAIRTDFTIQHSNSPIAIECFERIARFHILAVHMFCDREDMKSKGFDYRQEVEQMLKTLQSLIQFYDDNSGRYTSPNEAEFRAYYILAHIRSTAAFRRLHSLPQDIFLSPILQTALEFRSSAQRNTHSTASGRLAQTSKRFKNTEACLNAFTRFFKRVRDAGTSYLMACLVEYHFGDVRKGAVRALWRAYNRGYKGLPLGDFAQLIGLVNEGELVEVQEREEALTKTEEVARVFGIRTEVLDEEKLLLVNKNSNLDQQAWLTRHHENMVEKKRGYLEDVAIVNGEFEKAKETWTLRESFVDPEAFRRSAVTAEQPQRRSVPSTITPTWPMPTQPLRPATTATSFFPSASPAPQARNTFQHPVPFTLPPSSALGSASSQTQFLSTPGLRNFPSRTPIQPIVPGPSISSSNVFPTFPPSALTATAPAVNPPFTSLRRDEPLFTPESRTPAPTPSLKLQNAVAQPDLIPKPPDLHVTAPTPTPPPVPQFPEQTSTTPSPPPRQPTPPPPPPTHEEILLELHRVALVQRQEAKALAEKWYKRMVLGHAFGTWKSNVIRRGLEREKRSRFRKSVREMGLEGSVMGTAAREEAEEELLDWEEASVGSMSVSLSASVSGIGRRRSRGGKGKERKRADDEETLRAIKEAEATRLRLWQPGTFLSSLRRHIETVTFINANRHELLGWELWLVTSMENSSSRDWLRTKFGVDGESLEGKVEDGMVIDKMVVDEKDEVRYGPGIVVLDLAPSEDEGVAISWINTFISSLPSNRHYLPSILVLYWTESFPPGVTSMLDNLQRDEVINAWSSLTFVNDGTHFDDQFTKMVNILPVDVVGKLVEKVTVDEIFQIFLVPWDSALDEWLANCQMFSGTEYWSLYSDILKVMIDLLNRLAKEVMQVCNIDRSIKQLPPFEGRCIIDDESAFETVIAYLDQGWLGSDPGAVLLRAELHSGLAAGRKFYAQAVPERLARIILSQVKSILPVNDTFFMNSKNTPSNLFSFTDAILAALTPLQRVRLAKNPPPKRRAGEALDPSPSCSWSGSPENASKRRKQDNSDDDDEIVIIEPPPIVAANGHNAVITNGNKFHGNSLSRLRSTVARARQSVEDLRSMRLEASRRSASLEDDMTSSWRSTRESSPARQSPRPAWNDSMPVTLFDPKRDVNLTLIPCDETNLIRRRASNGLYPQFSPAATHFSSSTKSISYENHFAASTSPLNGLNASALKSPGDIPRVQEVKKFPAWSKLKDSVERAKKAVEEARLERLARSNGGG